jgi:hypothetical protein
VFPDKKFVIKMVSEPGETFVRLKCLWLRHASVTAALAISNIVKSSLGPLGLDKMLVDNIGVRVHFFRSD